MTHPPATQDERQQLYHPLVTNPDGFHPDERANLQQQIHDENITHCQTKSGDVFRIRQELNKKSIPLNDASAPPSKTRLPYDQVSSFGTLQETATATPEEGEGNPAENTPAHQDRAHAVLSASGAQRWLNCTPSALIEAGLPDNSSSAAEQGTAAHELAEHKLRLALGHPTELPESPWHDEAMEDHTDAYHDHVLAQLAEARETTPDAQLLLEQRLDFSEWVPGGFGTGDAVIVAEPTLHVIDFKYGQGVLVDADENPQMKLYALGAITAYQMLYDITEIHMVIYQPRRSSISEFIMSVDDLRDWAETVVKPAAALAAAGEGEFVPGEWCGFCKIKSTCRARASRNLEIAQYEFDDADEGADEAPAGQGFTDPVHLSDGEVADILARAPEVKKWLGDVEKHALSAAVDDGHQWPGFKLVAGRSTRKWGDEGEVAAAARNYGLPDDKIYEKKIKGIPALEKTLGKSEFKDTLGALVVKPEGKPTLVPESDKRPAITSRAAADEFSDLT